MISINLGNLQIHFTEKKDGNFGERFGAKEAKSNKKRILKKLKIDKKNVAEMNVNHTTNITNVSKPFSTKWTIFNKTDSLLTQLNDITLFLTTGDCIPLVFHDSANGAFGLVHVGWRNSIQNIHILALLKLSKYFGSQPKNVEVVLGPAIHSCCYQWKTPPPHLNFSEWKEHIQENNNTWFVDFVGYVEKSLILNGIRKKNIQILEECTFHNSNKWFSHHRSQHFKKPNGRLATLVTKNTISP